MNSKEIIVEEALALALSEGSRAVTLEKVANRAKVTKGGLLYHFRSKNELMREMLRYATDRFWLRVEDNLAQGMPLWEAMLEIAIEFRSSAQNLYASMVIATEADRKMLAENQFGYEQRMRALVESGLDRSQALSLCLLIDGLFASALLGKTALSAEEANVVRLTAGQICMGSKLAPHSPIAGRAELN